MDNSIGPMIITTSATPVDSPVLSSQGEEYNCDQNFLQLPTINSIKLENGLSFKESINSQCKSNITSSVVFDGKTKIVEKNANIEQPNCKYYILIISIFLFTL